MKKTGFTLEELIVVVIIIGILAILALSQYGSAKERALDKEAIANLKLISAAEKIYRMEATFYYPYSGTADAGGINSYLRLSLPPTTVATRNWDYSIALGGAGTAFDALGARYNPPSGWTRTYKMDQALDEPCCCPGSSNCPPGMSNCTSCP